MCLSIQVFVCSNFSHPQCTAFFWHREEKKIPASRTTKDSIACFSAFLFKMELERLLHYRTIRRISYNGKWSIALRIPYTQKPSKNSHTTLKKKRPYSFPWTPPQKKLHPADSLRSIRLSSHHIRVSTVLSVAGMYLSNPSDTRSVFKRGTAALNSEFSFYISCLTKIKKTQVCPTIHCWVKAEQIPMPRAFVQNDTNSFVQDLNSFHRFYFVRW